MLEEIIRVAAPKEIVVSALGVREGLLYSQLPPEIAGGRPADRLGARIQPPALARAGARRGAVRLDDAASSTRRISRRTTRTGACDTPPVFFPTFPGAPIRIIAAPRPTIWSPTRAFIGVDHPSRAFLALAGAYRHQSNEDFVTPQSRSLVSARQLDRARILGAAMRVAYNISAAMPGVLPRAPMVCEKGQVVLTLPAELAPLSGERLQSRIRQFARLIGGDPEIRASLSK